MATKRRKVPFEFVLESLVSVDFRTNPMFGCTAIYVGDQIVLILRERESPPGDDGVWVATTAEHHASLRRDLPSLRDIALFGPGTTGWQNIPVASPTFENEAIRACELVLAGDPRIGKVPARKRPRRRQAPE